MSKRDGRLNRVVKIMKGNKNKNELFYFWYHEINVKLPRNMGLSVKELVSIFKKLVQRGDLKFTPYPESLFSEGFFEWKE